MTNAELIKVLRYCGNFTDREECDEECPYFNDNDCPKRIMYDAADALEEVERLLDQNTKRCEALRKQLREAHESYEKHINELEAQLQKEGEWMTNIRLDYQQPSQSATKNVGTHFLCRSTGKLCPNATEYGYCKQTVCTIDLA